MCEHLTTADWIQIVIAFITFLGIATSIVITVLTLKQNSKMIKESTRAYILFYVDFHPQTQMYYLVIKNFGNSIGKLLNMSITPNINWKKCHFKQNIKHLRDSTNVLLAPNQKISSWFDFKEYPDKKFKVELKYETLNKIYTESYEIDLSFISNHDWLFNYAVDDNTNDYKKVLYKINNSILDLSDTNR